MPEGVTREQFAEVYPMAYRAAVEGRALDDDPTLKSVFYDTVASSLKCKVESGLDVVNYPQHFDMHNQFLDPIMAHQTDPFLIDPKFAVIPELYVAEKEAESYYEETGERLKLKVCVTGPIDLYLKTDFGYNVYEDVLMNLAESVGHFIRNSLLDTKYVKTAVVAIDEPSLGFVDLLNVEDDGLIRALETALAGCKAQVQIHLHTLKSADIPLNVDGIDVLTGEFAASPQNMLLISKETLKAHDKFIRAGVSRTNIDTIIGELVEKGQVAEGAVLADTADVIAGRFKEAKERFGERMTFVGPDCGLGSWPSQEVAQMVLKRTVDGIRG